MEIATIANESGVDPVQLRADVGAAAAYSEGKGELLSARGAGGAARGAGGPGREPRSRAGRAAGQRPARLSPAVNFDADYEHLARFTDALRTLSRAVCVRNLQVRRGSREVAVQMELEYYVQERN